MLNSGIGSDPFKRVYDGIRWPVDAWDGMGRKGGKEGKGR
jgi:hypothetical protein